MTRTFDLWEWFARTTGAGGSGLRSTHAVVEILDAETYSPLVRFILERCLAVRLKGPALFAMRGAIAIEELELAYESLRVEQPR